MLCSMCTTVLSSLPLTSLTYACRGALLIISKTSEFSHKWYKDTSEQLIISPSQQSKIFCTGHKDLCTAHAHLTGFTSIRQAKGCQ